MRTTRLRLNTVAATLAILGGGFASHAHADGLYLGASLGSSSVDELLLDDSDTGWKLFAGYKFTPNLAIEGTWVELGKFSQNFENIAQVDAESDGLAVQGVGYLPVSEHFELFGKLGLFFWDTELRARIGNQPGLQHTDDGNDIVFGFGAQFYLTPSIAIRGEWERYEFDFPTAGVSIDSEVDLISVGIAAHF